jgi:hypothetical protein
MLFCISPVLSIQLHIVLNQIVVKITELNYNVFIIILLCISLFS